MSVIWSAENNWRANAAGLSGIGCVSQADSPCKSEAGAGRSSTGNSGSPVSRLNTNTCPDLVTWATASIFLAAPAHGHEIRRRGQIAVPQVVMNKLKVPHPPAGGGVERQQAIGVEVLSDAIATPKIKRG